jgi:nitrite reductase/ring-hydroxylating ferredoxin subunit
MSVVPDYLIPAGVAAGLLAAIPGALDYFKSVPPQSSAKERATKHALLNVSALGLFTVSWLLGRSHRRRTLPLLLQGLGTAAMSIAGYMGGTLVYRNQIGVDHRYAGAGKWREESRGDANSRALVSAAASLEVNQMKLVHAEGRRIAVGRTEDRYAAFQDRCTHKGGPLSDGVLICGTVQCPWHGSQFDVYTGEVKCGPATEPISTYPIENAHRVAKGG